MRAMMFGSFGTIVAMTLAVPALASDRLGHQAIATGDFAGAARHLEAERKLFPSRPELMLNLAVAYARIGRLSDARELYAEVLTAAPVEMTLMSGAVASSHDVAARGLSLLPTPNAAIATR